MPSPLLIVFLSSLMTMLNAQDPKHLCTKVMSGHFDRIQFKSITYDYRREEILIFESDRKYLIPKASLPANHSSIPIGPYSAWDNGEVGVTVKKMELTSKVKALFIVEARLPVEDSYVDYTPGLNLLSADSEYMWHFGLNFWKRPFKGNDWKSLSRVHPDYSLITESNDSGTSGYAIHKDIYNKRDPFIVYDLNAIKWGLDFSALHRLDANEETRAKAPFYYLEKTQRPSEVVLVHRANIDVPRDNDVVTRRPGDLRVRSLFTALPVGYRHLGKVYLMDVALGCVYVINEFGSLNKEFFSSPPKDEHRHRRNIPYERFFSCDPRLYPPAPDLAHRHPINRCETVFSRAEVPVTFHVDRFATPTIFFIIGLLVSVILIILVVLLYYRYCLSSSEGKAKGDGKDRLAANKKKLDKYIARAAARAKKVRKDVVDKAISTLGPEAFERASSPKTILSSSTSKLKETNNREDDVEKDGGTVTPTSSSPKSSTADHISSPKKTTSTDKRSPKKKPPKSLPRRTMSMML